MSQHARTKARPSPKQFLRQTLKAWGGIGDFWVFAYASLIWRPEFAEAERRSARVYGWHRSLNMWSTINRGTPEQPGLVFALLPGGQCQGVAVRMQPHHVERDLHTLWEREMPSGVYDPKFIPCATPKGRVQALAFTLKSSSPRCCGQLQTPQLQHIFDTAQGRYGTTRDYAVNTYESLKANGIEDLGLKHMLREAGCG